MYIGMYRTSITKQLFNSMTSVFYRPKIQNKETHLFCNII